MLQPDAINWAHGMVILSAVYPLSGTMRTKAEGSFSSPFNGTSDQIYIDKTRVMLQAAHGLSERF